jgi:ATP-dependent helicase/nuclease subunit A
MTSDASARTAALDPAGSFIVQAPAGSGKTELLTQRYLRVLANVEAPEKILAITFTRKAAAEMRARILRALDDAAGEPPASAHKLKTWELARAVRDQDTRQHWHLIEHPSRLRIQTIDALNSSLARRLPVLAGTGSALEPTGDAWPLYEAAGRKLIEHLGDGSPVALELEVLILHLGNRVDRLIELLCDLLAKRDQWLHPVVSARASTNLRGTLEATLDRLVRRHLDALCSSIGENRLRELQALLNYAAGNLVATPDASHARRLRPQRCLDRIEPLNASSDCLNVWRSIAAMLLKQDGDLYSTVTVTHGFPTTNREMKGRMLAMLRSLAGDEGLIDRIREVQSLPEPLYSEEQWKTLKALLELLPAAVAELQLAFQVEGKADYVEVALRALRALGPPDEPTDLALAFDYRIQHLLVDEFQDTSFAQLDLLERLTAGWTRGDGRTLFCVGDPMQSIYRFRQADVGLFIELQERGLQHLRLEPLRLTENFRSTPALVDWVNRVFPAVLAPENDVEQGAVRYSPSTSATTSSEGEVRVHAFVNADDEVEAEFIVSIVRETLAADATQNIAILVSARSHVGTIARQLAAARIQFQAIEIERLRERPLVQDLIALTRALVHLGDRTAWLAVLRAPWCGLTLADLHALAADASLVIHDASAAALDVHADLSDDGHRRLERVHKILSAALMERGRWALRTWVERTWNALGGPATLSREEDLEDAEAFFRRLDEVENAGDLEDVARLDEQLERLFAGGRTEGPVRVELMTIHAAKGLEFDTVILPGLQRQTRGEDRELLRWTRIAGAAGGVVLAPIKAEGSDSDSIYRWLELLERQRSLRERARLLYVAVTRAKRNLHLLGNAVATVRDDTIDIREPKRGSMLQMLWGAVASQFDTATPEPESHGGRVASSFRVIRRVPSSWEVPEFETTAESVEAAAIDLEREQPVFDWVTETSRHVGTLVHRELDRICRGSVSDVLAKPSEVRTRLMIELAELGVPAERCEAAGERVIEALLRTLKDDRGRWVLGMNSDVRDAESELALSGVIDGRILNGVIDRTLVDADNTRWVVDFKTSSHEGGGLEDFIGSEVVRYRPQLARYVRLMRAYRPFEVVRAALYFPLLGVWREVDV